MMIRISLTIVLFSTRVHEKGVEVNKRKIKVLFSQELSNSRLVVSKYIHASLWDLCKSKAMLLVCVVLWYDSNWLVERALRNNGGHNTPWNNESLIKISNSTKVGGRGRCLPIVVRKQRIKWVDSLVASSLTNASVGIHTLAGKVSAIFVMDLQYGREEETKQGSILSPYHPFCCCCCTRK